MDLPAIRFRKKHSLGEITCLLRAHESRCLERESGLRISPSREVRLLHLDSGETVIVEDGKLLSAGRWDGQLGRTLHGALTWKSHRTEQEFSELVHGSSLSATAVQIAQSWEGKFLFRNGMKDPTSSGALDEDQLGLRPPQKGALHAIGAHWSLERRAATVVMPTGTGKTETMLAAFTAYVCSPLLVVVPSDALRTQTALKFQGLGLLRKLGLIPFETLNPLVGVMKRVPRSEEELDFFESCNVVIATASAICSRADLLDSIAARCNTLFIDEAHHVKARTWQQLKEAFSNRHVVQFTATPFRRDKQLVDGKVIFSYPLSLAQQDGYFKPITFKSVYVPGNRDNADVEVATHAVAQLNSDLESHLDHVLMARCASIERANEVSLIYRRIAPQHAPILVHSKLENAKALIEELRAGRSRVVICVDMLGEGFDLPQLKIAAIHDSHKSLAIFLQFVGRFARTKGAKIGDATVIANIADRKLKGALESLYSEDADWNKLLSEMSSDAAREHAELLDFLHSSQRIDAGEDAEFPLQLLRPSFSTVVYEASEFWPKQFHRAFGSDLEIRAVWIHEQWKALYFVTKCRPNLRWVRSKEVFDTIWHLYVLHFHQTSGLLFISSTDGASLHAPLAEAVTGEKRIFDGERVFRSMSGIARLTLNSVGVKKFGTRSVSHTSFMGQSVAEGWPAAQRVSSIKNNMSGAGWEGGERVSGGCSQKGRIWRVDQGSVLDLIRWFHRLAAKLTDHSIDIGALLGSVLIPKEISELPDKMVLCIDWPDGWNEVAEGRIEVVEQSTDELVTPIYLTELRLAQASQDQIAFEIAGAGDRLIGRFSMGLNGGSVVVDQIAGPPNLIRLGKSELRASDYFRENPITIRYVDLSELRGDKYVCPDVAPNPVLESALFEEWDWSGVNLRVERMWRNGALDESSIQWRAVRHYSERGFDIIFDDDEAGEAADLVCLRDGDENVAISLVHCKFSTGDDPGRRVKDVVEVAAQAVRSCRWKWRLEELLLHIEQRAISLELHGRTTRFVRGDVAALANIRNSLRSKPPDFQVVVVQPGLSAANRTPAQNQVLAAAHVYMHEAIGRTIRIVCSP